jgi:hypothetical protein
MALLKKHGLRAIVNGMDSLPYQLRKKTAIKPMGKMRYVCNLLSSHQRPMPELPRAATQSKPSTQGLTP